MKVFKGIFITIVVLTAFALLSVFSANAASCSLKAKVSASNVNIRTGAGTSSGIIATAKKNTAVTLINTKLYNNDWYKIKLKSGKKGYIHKDYLKLDNNQLFIAKKATGYAGYKFTFKPVNTTGSVVKWTSSDKTVATVTAKGVVKSLKEGTVVITAKTGTATTQSTVTVVNADVKITEAPKEMFIDETVTLKAECKKAVTFKSSDTEIAVIDKNGVITPVSAGTATFTAESKSGTASCTIKFKKRTITLKASKTSLHTGNRVFLKASGGLSAYGYKSSNTAVLTVSSEGLITAVGEGTAKITCTSGDLKKTKKFTVNKGDYIDISHTSGTVKAGMTLYLKSNTSGVKWSCDNTSVATVENGYVLGVSKGQAIITVTTDKGSSDCLVTVENPRAVRFAYTSENSAFTGDTVTFYAITDTERSNVKFEITAPDGKKSQITNTSKVTEDGRYVWSGKKKLTTVGEYTVTAYSKKSNGSWETDATGGYCTTFVSDAQSKSQVGFGERRASSDLINIIAEHEGFVGTVYTDKLANVPTVGYGRVVYAGSTFYNGMTKKEAFAFLIKTVNESGFTSRMNKILTENKIKFSQQHFDALLDFSYNLGAYAITNNEELYNTLLNSYGSEDYKFKGFINSTNVVVTKKADSSSSVLAKLSAGTEITMVNGKLHNSKWYKIKLSDDTTGFVLADAITRRTTTVNTRNLNNVAVETFAKNYLPYHHAGGNCYVGLLRRRVDEVETFFYGDYIRDGVSNKYKLSYTCSKNSDIHL